jgi:hypothetical protein
MWFLKPPPIRKSGESVNEAYIEKAMAKSQPVFETKRFQDRFPCHAGMTSQPSLPTQSGTSNGGKSVKMIQFPLFLPDISPAEFALCQRS